MIPYFGSRYHRTIRIFISSTFKDLQIEREILVRSVFPRLRKAFADRSVEIIEIDLRWGLPDNLSESGKIIEICLGEVLRCKPFFIGIVGERYGYIPNNYEICNTTSDLKLYLGENPVGMSITEMEICTGLNPTFGNSVYSFYMKANGDNDRLQNLKKKLESHNGHYYDSTQTFEEQAYSILYKQIDEYVPHFELPYDDEEYPYHLAFLEERTIGYVELESDRELINYVNSYNFIHLVGDKGFGKTSRMANLIKEYGANDDAAVFFHFSDSRYNSMDLKIICKRFNKFIRHHIGEISTTSDNPESLFKELIRSWPEGHTLYIFIDAVEKINTKQNLATILYELSTYNSSLHIICSSTSSILNIEENAPEFKIHELSRKNKRDIIESYLKKYGKVLNEKQLEIITSNQCIKSPLMLMAVSNLLRVYGDYDTFNTQINLINKIDKLSDLFDLLLDNAKKATSCYNVDPETVLEILCTLAYSYNGLREHSISEIIQIPPIIRIIVLQAFELFIIDTEGFLKINHDLMIDYLVKRGKIIENTCRERIICYNRNIKNEESYLELAYQYRMIGNVNSLVDLITNRDVYISIRNRDYNLLIQSFNSIRNHSKLLEEALFKRTDTVDLPHLCPILVQSGCFSECIKIAERDLSKLDLKSKLEIMNSVARSEYKLALDSFGRACKTYELIIEEYKNNYPNDILGMSEYLLKYAISCVSNGRVNDATRVYKMLIHVFKTMKIENYYSSWAAGNLASCLMRLGWIRESHSFYEYALNVRKKLYGEESPEVAWELCYYWTYLEKTERRNEAEKESKNAVRIYKKTYGENSMECAWSLMNYGSSLFFKGSFEEAYNAYSQSIELNDSILSENMRPHSYSLTAYNNRALISIVKGTRDTSEFQQILKYKEEKNGLNHPYTANTYICLGGIIDDKNLAISYYNRALEILESGQYAGGPDSCFIELCKLLIIGNGETELHNILSKYKFPYCENPDIVFLIKCIKGFKPINHPMISVSHNNGSELICYPLCLFDRIAILR